MTKSTTKTYYDELGLHPSATEREIRRAYRELSKRYHPDTTTLPVAVATPKFQRVNEAYATLSNYERRLVYDAKIRYSRVIVAQAAPDLRRPSAGAADSPGFIDPIDRPLSSGEVFALFLMGATIVGCLALAIGIAVLRGDPW
ncbi:MAG: J domain-containing protein [Geitlerinemataceae cyanobacterium]